MKKHTFSRSIFVLIATVLGSLTLPIAMAQQPQHSAQQSASRVKVFASDSVISGKTYGDWSAAWQQWADSLPVAAHPLFDTADCSAGQSGPVWFLGGKFCRNNATDCGTSNVIRTCNLPAGKAVYLAVFNSEDSVLEESKFGNGQIQTAGLRSYVASAIDQTADLSLELDGVPVPHLKERFRVQSPTFGFTLTEDNLFKAVYPPEMEFPAGTYFPAVDDGVYVMLLPSPGSQHVLHLHGSLPAYNFILDITYYLNVGVQ